MLFMKEVGVDLQKGLIQVISEEVAEVVVIVGPDQNQEQELIDTELGVISVREYDHFAKDCPTMTQEERETEQMQEMFNLDEEQTPLKTLATDTYDSLNHVNSLEEVRPEHLNL